MGATITWSISKNGLMTQTIDSNTDAVVAVQFTVTATDGVNTVNIRNVTRLGAPDAAAFTPFANLTEAQVIAWVKSALPAGKEAQLETMLTRMLELKANPPVRPVPKPAPWNTCSQG